ncbi:trypsin-like peptidase domain-containing protein [Emticicia sp. SJ17W-69]|uniref:trypsin-like peptidase domain-containing protein n=1 Tax=Emticicia sp. SJ17W-69 TaxID=3421657 RepID=UPI003EBEF70E
MFVDAIEEVGQYTRAIQFISRNYNEKIITGGAATLFFVNEFACAITCKHVMDLIGNRAVINQNYANFRRERAAIAQNAQYQEALKQLETKYNYKSDVMVELSERFLDCTADSELRFRWINHPKYDLSIIIFDDFSQPLYQSYARFLKDGSSLKQGKSLCRLGYPFPEFTNFQYDQKSDEISWTNTGIIGTPRFPIDGMLTRHLVDEGTIFGVELSTPGLRGQSGGPLFDRNGLVCGMQSKTNALHLGFDMMDAEHNVNGKTIKVNNQPFLHVGHCIHVDIIKTFLAKNGIKFYEE